MRADYAFVRGWRAFEQRSRLGYERSGKILISSEMMRRWYNTLVERHQGDDQRQHQRDNDRDSGHVRDDEGPRVRQNRMSHIWFHLFLCG